MTIQELFRKSDAEIVFHAYTLIRPVFDEFDDHTMQERATVLKKLRSHIKTVCNQIASCETTTAERSKTLFVIGRSRLEWGESYLQDLECFTTYDDDASNAVKCNFTMWNDDGDVRLPFYGIDFESIPVIAGYNIAKPSVVEQGIDVCCAVILRELFRWGHTEEHRKESFKDLCERLKEAEIDVDSGNTITSEELRDYFDNKFMEHASEDEKMHHLYKREFEEKVEEIEQRYREDIILKDHQRVIDIVKKEYTRGCV